jgi:lipopolysaccharide export system permease protein
MRRAAGKTPRRLADRASRFTKGKDARAKPVLVGILQRYVLGEVVRAFTLALVTITCIFVLFMIMAEAMRMGLSPRDIFTLVPFVVPGSLPYTIPVSLLFAITVVFGRLAADNEILAVKTAGLSAWTVLLPAITLGLGLSGLLLYLSNGPIPRANNMAKLVIYKNMEEMFYKFLRKDREFNNPKWPFLITVKDVRGKVMIDATFKHRVGGPGKQNSFDMVVQAKEAQIHFDTGAGEARVYLVDAEIVNPREDVSLINNQTLVFEIPTTNDALNEKRPQEWTTSEMTMEQAKFRRLIQKERQRQAMAAALWIGRGQFGRVKWAEVQIAFIDFGYWKQMLDVYETEKQMRVALACGSFFFVLLGAPVGILFAKGDFLSAFITCFVPIIVLYYPLTLLAVNLGKDGILNPTLALWGGNTLLAILAGFVLPPIIRH